MNIQSIILALIIFIIFVWALYKSKHTSSCSGQCSNCHATCSSKNKGEPDWVKRYKRDHPKN